MADWMTGEAKQGFSELLRRCEEEPQRIFRRDRFVAAVVSARDYEELQRSHEGRRRSLGRRFDEVREICARYGYELDPGERRDRRTWVDEP